MHFKKFIIKYDSLIPISLAIIAMVSSFICTYSSGILITYDSGVYAIGAKSILYTGNYLTLDGTHNKLSPPLFSFLLIPNYILGLQLSSYAKFINLICYGFIVWAYSHFILKSHLEIPFKLFGLLMLVFCTNFFMVTNFIWTESAFCLTQLLGLHFLEKYRLKKENSSLIISILIFLLGYLLRNLGIVGICLWFFILIITANNINTIIKNFLVGFALCIVLYFIWPLYYTYNQHSNIYTFPKDYSRVAVWGKYFSVIYDDILPFSTINIFGSSLFLIFVGSIAKFSKIKGFDSYVLYFFTYTMFLGILYMYFIPYSSSDVHRYNVPISLLHIYILCTILNHFLKKTKKIYLYVILTLLIIYPSVRYTKNWLLWNTYSTPSIDKAIFKNDHIGKVKYSKNAEVDNVFLKQMVFYPSKIK